jgi:hypothetical protein
MRYPTSVGLLSLLTCLPLSSGITQESTPNRPLPGPIVPPPAFQSAVERGTRTETGEPGPAYWQDWTDYHLTARLDPEGKRLEGTGRIVYHNHGPTPLPVVALYLVQNVFAEGAVRGRPVEVTGGIEIRHLRVGGEESPVITDRSQRGAGHAVEGTNLMIRLPEPVATGDSLEIVVDWAYTIPQRGRSGWNADNLFHVAYWYPQMAVHDDVTGWQRDQFRGVAEFYHGFGTYDVTIEVPDGWIVMATGRLLNAEEVLAPPVLERYRRAHESDSVVHVLTEADFGPGTATRQSDDGWHRWRFHADSVRDVAFGAMRASQWDAARVAVGDRDGDGATDYSLVNSFWRSSAPRWQEGWRYAQFSIAFLSRWLDHPYPWPHMTAVEGGGIMGGGMEYPMMTLMGAGRSDSAQFPDTTFFSVTAHELAHMWVPMIVSTDERRHGWMDEGLTSFNGTQAEDAFFPGVDHSVGDRNAYLNAARRGQGGEIMRYSDFHPGGYEYTSASYWKPNTLLSVLRAVLGGEVFVEALRTFIDRWAYKHPTPWDFFNTFEAVSSRELDWFWWSWYYETWTLDHAVADVVTDDDGTTIVLEDRGWALLPTRVAITRADGTVVEREVPVDVWLSGATQSELRLPPGSPVVRVELDAAHAFPDLDRENNVWERRDGGR